MKIPALGSDVGAIGGSTAVAYGRAALTVAILAPLFILLTLSGVQEYRETVGVFP